MRKDKEKALELRKSGKSYKEIRKELGTPIATLSDWFRNLDWSRDLKKVLFKKSTYINPDKVALMVAATKKKNASLRKRYQEEAIKEFPALKLDPLFIAGIMLYWGEGDKNISNSSVKLANSDMGMIRSFYIFLVSIMKIPREEIAFNLLLYPDLVDSVQKNTWSMATGIPLTQFRKSIFIRGHHPAKRLSHGVGMIRVGGRKRKEKIMKWIELYMREINSRVIV